MWSTPVAKASAGKNVIPAFATAMTGKNVTPAFAMATAGKNVVNVFNGVNGKMPGKSIQCACPAKRDFLG